MGSEDPTPMKLGQNKDGNQMPHQSIDITDFRSLAAIIFHFLKNTCHDCAKHVSEDNGMFTLRVEGFFRLCIYICIKRSKG